MRASRLILLLVFILSAGALQAQTTYTWDPNGLTADTGTSGGIWDTSTPNWANGGVAVWFNDGSVRAVFPISLTPETDTYIAGGSYTIDVATAIQTRGMDLGAIYWNPSSTTTFTGVGSITLTDSHITVEDTTAAFNVPLISTVGLELDKSFNTGGTLQLNTANPGLAGVTTLTRGTLVYNHPGALGPETAGNGIVIGQGTLNFNYVSGGDFSYSLADPITISGTNEFAPHFSIEFETYASRSATLTGPITLQQDVKFQGGPLNDYGSAQIISTGVISESSAGKNVRIVGDVALSGANTFTGKLYLGNGYNDDGRVTVPVFNDDLADGPLGAGSGLQLGYNAGEGGAHGEVMYTGGTASSNRTIQIEGDLGVLRVSNPSSTLTLTGIISGSGS
ncbi:MAG: hypothetical protein PSW75_02235, partial [bacterium]|nr:hypothetical protein [bacterium]